MKRLAMVLLFVVGHAQALDVVQCVADSKVIGKMHEAQIKGMTDEEILAETLDLIANGELSPDAGEKVMLLWDWTAKQDARLTAAQVKFNWQQQVCEVNRRHD